MKMEKKYSK